MQTISKSFRFAVIFTGLLMMAGSIALAQPVLAAELGAGQNPADANQPEKKPLDRSGRVRVGKASFYADRFGGRKMADGTPMKLTGNNAASRTLPLGTTAMVTNLKTGRSALVMIRDRGPYAGGRIVDLSPSTAQKIGLERKQGIAEVKITPIVVPLPDGNVKRIALNGSVTLDPSDADGWGG